MQKYYDQLSIKDFKKIDLRVGLILAAEVIKRAKAKKYRLTVDFGEEIGMKKTLASIADSYGPKELRGMQVIGVVNIKPQPKENMENEVYILGVLNKDGVVLLKPDKIVDLEDKV